MGEEQINDVSWALKILEREGDYRESVWTRYFHQGWCGLVGFAVPLTGNYLLKRPWWAGIQVHFLMALAGIGVGTFLRKREIEILATNDAILRDYIRLHPEDFPEPERKKWSEVFIHWIPIR